MRQLRLGAAKFQWLVGAWPRSVGMHPPLFTDQFLVVAAFVFSFFAMLVAMFVAIVIAMVLAVIARVSVPLAAPLWMLLLVTLPHPLFLYKIHRLATRVVACAVFAPLLLVPRWNVQVDRLALHEHGGRCNDHRLRVHEHWRRVVADINAPIDARLINANRHPHTGLGKKGA